MRAQLASLTPSGNRLLNRLWRSFRMALWLGWQIESNWTDPFLFAVYSIVRPVSSSLILVVMYMVITNGATDAPIFSYLFLGQAFYQYVGSVVAGIAWAVLDDREHYQMLRFIYISPINYPTYLIGRGGTRFLTGTISVLITLFVGVVFLDVRLAPLFSINWGLFAVAMVLGITGLIAIGMGLAGVTLLLRSSAGFFGEAMAGALYLFSGAIFPLEVLPQFLRPVGYALPVTYWLELIRRALLGEGAAAFPTFAAYTDAQLLVILSVVTVIYIAIAAVLFHLCETSARRRGVLDTQSFY